jgi:ABC-2 type transport system permease protein
VTDATDVTVHATVGREAAGARRAGFAADVATLGRRAVILMGRDLAGVIPAIVVPLFFFVVNVGSLQDQTERAFPGLDFKAFQLPVAIVFAVTGISRASNLVVDIEQGYFDRLTITPIRRSALLLGLMVADVVLVVALSVPVVVLGLVVGVDFATGAAGMVAFVALGGLWGLAYTGFPYAIALKTGSPAAVNSSFILFFPFAFLTTTFAPKEALTGWLSTVADYNPVTYLLVGLRSLVSDGWDGSAMLQALAAIVGVGVVSQLLAMAALRGRLRSGGR